jgi:hexokinase
MLVAAKQFHQMNNADNPKLKEFRTKTIEKKGIQNLKRIILTRAGFFF